MGSTETGQSPVKQVPVVFYRRPRPSRAFHLILRGYEKRVTATEPRLSEIVAEYLRIGFAVEVIDHEHGPQDCRVCFDASVEAVHKDVYVRASAATDGRSIPASSSVVCGFRSTPA